MREILESGTLAIAPDILLRHWQGHRRLTRRVIEAFPEEELFRFSIGGMRSFGTMAAELESIAAPYARGLATDAWPDRVLRDFQSRAELLRAWDEGTVAIDTAWASIPPARFQEELTAFGRFSGSGYDLLLYVIDNEIHHRGQGVVYLRALGIEPPAFHDRS